MNYTNFIFNHFLIDLLKYKGQKSKESILQLKSCLKSNVNFNVKRSGLDESKNSERRTMKMLKEFNNTKLKNLKRRKDGEKTQIKILYLLLFRIREAALIAEKDEEIARRLAAEEEDNLHPNPDDDESIAIRLANKEREKAERKKRQDEEDRKIAQRMLEKDFGKYQRMNNYSRPKSANIDDLLAIQQIELDRGNYNKPGLLRCPGFPELRF